MKTLKKDVRQIIDLQDAIDYMEAKMATASNKTRAIIERNKMLAELQLLKREEALRCKIQTIGSMDSTNSTKNSSQEEK